MNFLPQMCQKLSTIGLKTYPETRFFNSFAFRNPVHIRRHSKIIRCNIDCYSYIGEYTLCCTSKIGKYCSIADYVSMGLGQHDGTEFSTCNVFSRSKIFDFTGFQSKRETTFMQKRQGEETSNVTIGNDVWIGSYVVFPNDVKVGHGAIIGSGAVITKDVPPYAVVVGNNRIIKQRFSDEIVADMLEINWWDYDLPQMIHQGLDIPQSDPKAFIEHFKQIDPKDLIELPKDWYFVDLKDTSLTKLKLRIVKDPFVLYYDPHAPQEELQIFEDAQKYQEEQEQQEQQVQQVQQEQ